MDSAAVFYGYDVVDNRHFAAGAKAARARADEVRLQLQLPGHFFLVSCRFVHKKNLFGLLDAFACFRTADSTPDWSLVILGDGPLKGEIEDRITQLGLAESVHLMGFRQYDELPSFYGLAHAFVHASSVEPWGLVVNEAMAAGLPVLVSDSCGCAEELVIEGENGFKFLPDDTEELAKLMTFIAGKNCDREAMADSGRKIISSWQPERFAAGLRDAVEYAVGAHQPSAPKGLARLALRVFSRIENRNPRDISI
jgi:glycosyltransferase involved in cell wall biosynthesis